MASTAVTDTTILAAQGGDSDAMWSIVCAHEPEALSLIRRIAPSATPEQREDLLQEARATLIERIRSYDASLSTLTTYAYSAVRQALAEEWVRMAPGVTVDPTTAIRVKRALWNADGDYELAFLKLSAASNRKSAMSRETFLATVEALQDVASLEAPSGDDEHGATLADTIPDPGSDFTSPVERRDFARWLLGELASRQSLVLRAYYGIGMTKQVDSETATDLGIKHGALRELRSYATSRARVIADRGGYVISAA